MRTPAVLMAVVLASGCFGPSSNVDSSATLTVGGVVERENGAGDAVANVQLIRHSDALQTIGDVVEIIGTAGLACLAGNDSICHPYAQATSAADGSYAFGSIRGADTQGSVGQALLFTAWLRGPTPRTPATAPAGVNADFYIQKTQVTMPPLRLWETAGGENDVGGAASFSWPSLQSSIGSAADGYRLQITNAKGQTIWSSSATASSTQIGIDPRVTQDFAGNWAIWAHRKVPGDGTDFDVTYYSPSTAYASHGHIPASRGKECWLQGATGPVKQAPCPLTDGDLGTRLQPLPATQCPSGQVCTPPPQNNWVYIDLGAATTLSALVLYDVAFGSTSSCAVEGSLDAAEWTSIAGSITNQQYQLVTLSGTARYVRLRLIDARAQFPALGNSEIAIF